MLGSDDETSEKANLHRYADATSFSSTLAPWYTQPLTPDLIRDLPCCDDRRQQLKDPIARKAAEKKLRM